MSISIANTSLTRYEDVFNTMPKGSLTTPPIPSFPRLPKVQPSQFNMTKPTEDGVPTESTPCLTSWTYK